LLVALLVRGITPAGWMPNPQGLTGSPFVICTADGAHTVSLDRDGHPSRPATGERHDVCAFAGHQAGPAAEALLQLGSTRAEPVVVAQRAPAAPPVSAPRHRDQAPRAPPTLV
jgi:hypothetical protein